MHIKNKSKLLLIFPFILLAVILPTFLLLEIYDISRNGFYRNNIDRGFFYYNFSSPLLQEELEKSNYTIQLAKNPNIPYRIAILCRYDPLACMRIQQAASNLGWESLLISATTHPLDVTRIHGIVSQFNPDFTISAADFGVVAGVKSYLVLHFPCLINPDLGKYYCPNPLRYDGLLAVTDLKRINQYYESISIPIIDFKFSRPKTEFIKINYSRLFMCGYNWDNTRTGLKYKKLYQLLDKRKDVDIYGPKQAWNGLNSYRGFIPYDDQLFVDAIRKSGIGLAIHSEGHNTENFPSGRVLELVSSSALVIVDEIPWAKETFGDNILYIETLNKSSEEIYSQINQHLEWIKSHPEEAYEKVKKAHQIYLDKFTMEQILTNVANMHNKIISQEN
ncbi:MAG TPA: glycosyltransferase [Rickettsia endosymbiont of Omalisus fontisbellaquei]|nr:glycosyltransferase [Rickettsia endosymbiont of Omalisus fontisbellaquei]